MPDFTSKNFQDSGIWIPLDGEIQSKQKVASSKFILETRFEDKKNYEYKIWCKVFFAYCQKIDTSPEFFTVLLFTRKVSTVIDIEGGWALSRSQNAKTSNIW